MSQKSEVYVLDILMKNEAKHKDMIDIMNTLQSYLGDAAEYDEERRVLSGGDQVTCERQVGAQRHLMCGNTLRERVEILEPVGEDFHFLMCLLAVSLWAVGIADLHPEISMYSHTQSFK